MGDLRVGVEIHLERVGKVSSCNFREEGGPHREKEVILDGRKWDCYVLLSLVLLCPVSNCCVLLRVGR